MYVDIVYTVSHANDQEQTSGDGEPVKKVNTPKIKIYRVQIISPETDTFLKGKGACLCK